MKPGTIVVASIAGNAPTGTGEALLKEFGFGLEADPDCRWHKPGLVSLKINSPVSEDALERAKAMPGVERALALNGPLNR